MAEQSKERGIFEKVAGSGVYWIRYTDSQGKFRRERVGAYSLAVKLLAKRKGDAVAFRKMPETIRRPTVLFGELCDDTKAYVQRKYSKPQHDLGRLEVIRGWFGTKPADAVTLQEVEAMLDRVADANDWSPSSWNHHHTLMSLTYRLGIRNGKVERNPAHGIKRRTENNSRVRFLTADEEAKLREAIRSNPSWTDHEPELDLALATGLRRSSMYELTWENVDLAERVATIERTKNGDSITVPLNSDAVRALMIFRSRGDGTGRVVRNANGFSLQFNAFWFVPALRAAGIKNFRWHDCRHTYASRLRQKGVPLGNIAELLGHRGLAMSRRYAHLSISNLHEAVAKLESVSPPVAPEAAAPESRIEYVQ